eukprot:TRINITY_DN1635_c1_g1_i1.p3 TRINITY_DN1635_c1_g1~~TRINITY_DN1635_c1_g1_i1.p3  ORF type:complete len:347 (+),score=53.20 TRINITY_DN1635_c1_g1_i1:78-1118(+)
MQQQPQTVNRVKSPTLVYKTRQLRYKSVPYKTRVSVPTRCAVSLSTQSYGKAVERRSTPYLLFNDLLAAVSLSAVCTLTLVDLPVAEKTVIVGFAVAALADALSLVDFVGNLFAWQNSVHGREPTVSPEDITNVVVEDDVALLMNMFKPSPTEEEQATKQREEEKVLKERQVVVEEEEWMEKDVPSEIQEEIEEEIQAEQEQEVKSVEQSVEQEDESGAASDGDISETQQEIYQVIENVEEDEDKEPTVSPGQTNCIKIDYISSWPKAILHGSIRGGEWSDLAECYDDKIFTFNIDQQDSDSAVPLLEFVLTDGNGDWDHTFGGENYSIYKVGSYQIKDGVLKLVE